MIKPTAELYSWEFYDSPYGDKCLRGIIKNDSAGRWSDGHRIFTSPVVEQNGLTAITHNTAYKLMGDWKGPWIHRTLEDRLVTEEGPVHFNIVRWAGL